MKSQPSSHRKCQLVGVKCIAPFGFLCFIAPPSWMEHYSVLLTGCSDGLSQNHQSNEKGQPVIRTKIMASNPFLFLLCASLKSQTNDHIEMSTKAIAIGKTTPAGPSKSIPDPLIDAGLKRIRAKVTNAAVSVSKFIGANIIFRTFKVSRDHSWRGVCCSEHNP